MPTRVSLLVVVFLVSIAGPSAYAGIGLDRLRECVLRLLAQGSMEPVSQMNGGPDPLLASINKMGDPRVPVEWKSRVVLTASSLLGALGTPKSLVKEIRSQEFRLAPLGTQVLRRLPVASELPFLEGRGSYQQIGLSGKAATVYTKGSGNPQAFNSGPFPAFPSSFDPSQIYFDTVGIGTEHPRVLGTETVTWGALELINAALIFHHLAGQFQIRSLGRAVELGVTIPLQVFHFPELTQHISGFTDEAIRRSGNRFDRESMDYAGNRLGLGAVQMIVPTNQRNTLSSSELDESVALSRRAELWRAPETPIRVARTLRTLLEAGFVYSDVSSHAQNMYRRGLVAQADNSDLVFLGGLKARTIDQKLRTVREQGQVAVAKQILRSRDLLPPFLPTLGSLEWDAVRAIQAAFWEELLINTLIDPQIRRRVSAEIPRLMVKNPTATAFALGQLLFDSVSTRLGKQWAETDEHRNRFFATVSEFRVAEAYAAKLEANIYYTNLYDLDHIRKHYPLEPILKYLSGNTSALESGCRELQQLERLLTAIEKVVNRDLRDRLILRFSQLASKEYPVEESSSDPVLELFGFRHVGLIEQLLGDRRFDEAEAVFEVLNSFGYGYRGLLHTFNSKFVPSRIHYNYELLLHPESIMETAEAARFQATAAALASSSSGFSTSSILRRLGEDSPVQDDLHEQIEYRMEHLIFALLGSQSDPAERRKILQWTQSLAIALAEFEESGFSSEAMFESLKRDSAFDDAPELSLVLEIQLYNQLWREKKIDSAKPHFESVRRFLEDQEGSQTLAGVIKKRGFSSVNQLLQAFPHHNHIKEEPGALDALSSALEKDGLPKAAHYLKFKSRYRKFPSDG